MRFTFYRKDTQKHFSIYPTQHDNKKDIHVWLSNEEGEGGQFNADEVNGVIYDALEKYFKENH